MNRYATPTMQFSTEFLSDRNMKPPSTTGKKITLPQMKTKPGENTSVLTAQIRRLDSASERTQDDVTSRVYVKLQDDLFFSRTAANSFANSTVLTCKSQVSKLFPSSAFARSLTVFAAAS